MNLRACRRWLLVVCVLPSAAVTMGAARLHLMGALPRGVYAESYTVAFAISGDGRVVAGQKRSREPNYATADVPFHARRSGPVQRIPVAAPELDAALLITEGRAVGISADGSVVVGHGYDTAGWLRGFRWTREGGTVYLNPSPDTSMMMGGISGDGHVLVGRFSHSRPGYSEWPPLERPFRWSAEMGLVELGTSGWASGFGAAANYDGSVIVGWLRDELGFFYASRWLSGGQPEVLSGASRGLSYASAVTPDGSVMAGAIILPTGIPFYAFRWTERDGMQLLNDDASIATEVNAISADGSRIVGTMSSTNIEYNGGAMIWTQASGVQPMDAAFPRIRPKGWHFLTANAISADGRWIVGVGYSAAVGHRGYILDTGEVRGSGVR